MRLQKTIDDLNKMIIAEENALAELNSKISAINI